MSIVIPDVRSPINQHTLNGGMVASPTTTGASASWGVFSPSSAQTAFSLPTGHGMGDVGPGGAGTSYGGSTAYNSQGGPPSGIIVDEDTMSSTKDDAQSKQSVIFAYPFFLSFFLSPSVILFILLYVLSCLSRLRASLPITRRCFSCLGRA
jgi:hypothetical protein